MMVSQCAAAGRSAAVDARQSAANTPVIAAITIARSDNPSQTNNNKPGRAIRG